MEAVSEEFLDEFASLVDALDVFEEGVVTRLAMRSPPTTRTTAERAKNVCRSCEVIMVVRYHLFHGGGQVGSELVSTGGLTQYAVELSNQIV